MERRPDGRVMLSKRLQMLADMVTPGLRLVDVGCDHGFLSIYLVQRGICPKALAMDVRSGPLAGAGRHVEECGLGDYISVRLSDGLEACGAGEAEAMVCAGMGGRLMERILEDGLDKARKMRELILQPQSEIPQFRAYLREAGFGVTAEAAVCEEGKYYFAMKAVSEPIAGRTASGEAEGVRLPKGVEAAEQESAGEGAWPGTAAEGGTGDKIYRESSPWKPQQLYDAFGELLLQERHPVLLAYLEQRKRYLARLAASLGKADSSKAEGRLDQVREEISQIEEALTFYGE